MRKNILILISIILVGVLILYALKSQKNRTDIHSKSTHLDEVLQPTVKQTVKQEMTHPSFKQNKPLKNSETYEDTTSKTASTQTHLLYETLPLEEANMITKEKRHIEPVSAIKLNTDTFSSLQTGDSLTLPDIDGIDYTLTVVDVQTYDNGATSTTAKYEDEGVTYTTTITHSSNETFITLATAQGMYEIEAEQGTGYVYDSSHIRKQMQRPGKSDVIVLPVPKK
jgi:cytoskeletal protein RodZ